MNNAIEKVGENLSLPTKTNISEQAALMAQLVKDGELNPLDAAVKAKAIIASCEEFLSQINDYVVDEVAKYGKSTSALGAKIEVRETGVKYDFTGSEAWNKIKSEEDRIAEKRKQVEAIAKNCPSGSELQWTDIDTGEMLSIQVAAKSSKTSFAITISK